MFFEVPHSLAHGQRYYFNFFIQYWCDSAVPVEIEIAPFFIVCRWRNNTPHTARKPFPYGGVKIFKLPPCKALTITPAMVFSSHQLIVNLEFVLSAPKAKSKKRTGTLQKHQ